MGSFNNDAPRLSRLVFLVMSLALLYCIVTSTLLSGGYYNAEKAEPSARSWTESAPITYRENAPQTDDQLPAEIELLEKNETPLAQLPETEGDAPQGIPAVLLYSLRAE